MYLRQPSCRASFDVAGARGASNRISQEGNSSEIVDNTLAVTLPRDDRIATLWQLTWNDHRMRCVVYRNENGMQMCLESATSVIMSVPFDMQPRSLARARALRDSLKRRGWQEP